MGCVGGEIADIWRLDTVPSTVIQRVGHYPLDGVRYVQRGRIQVRRAVVDGMSIREAPGCSACTGTR